MLAQLKLFPSGDFVIPLGSSHASNSRNKAKAQSHQYLERKQQGINGITSHGKKVIRSGLQILQDMVGRHNLTFLTITLPDLPLESLAKCLGKGWGELVDQWKQELVRELKRHGLSGDYVYSSELQPKRYETSKRIAPHLHIVFQGRISKFHPWAISIDKAKQIAKRCLENHVGHEVYADAMTRIEQVKYSVKHYLSKYISKGGKILEEVKQSGCTEYLPRSWWGISTPLRNAVTNGIKKLDAETSRYIEEHLDYLVQCNIIHWYKPVYRTFTDYSTNFEVQVLVAYVGGFNDSKPLDFQLTRIEKLKDVTLRNKERNNEW